MEEKTTEKSNVSDEVKYKAQKKKLLILIPVFLVLILFIAKLFPDTDTVPDAYLIKDDNYFDYQPHFECSGYASAYVLRSLGVEADGMDLYNQIPNKQADGTVPIEYLISFLKSLGYNAEVGRGSIAKLKEVISKDTPVITFVRIYPNAQYYHYLPVVGYDEEYIYTADSLGSLKNADEQYYNRKISIDDFKNMWSTKVVSDNTYILISLN